MRVSGLPFLQKSPCTGILVLLFDLAILLRLLCGEAVSTASSLCMCQFVHVARNDCSQAVDVADIQNLRDFASIGIFAIIITKYSHALTLNIIVHDREVLTALHASSAYLN